MLLETRESRNKCLYMLQITCLFLALPSLGHSDPADTSTNNTEGETASLGHLPKQTCSVRCCGLKAGLSMLEQCWKWIAIYCLYMFHLLPEMFPEAEVNTQALILSQYVLFSPVAYIDQNTPPTEETEL